MIDLKQQRMKFNLISLFGTRIKMKHFMNLCISIYKFWNFDQGFVFYEGPSPSHVWNNIFRFVCSWFIVPLDIFPYGDHYRWRAGNFDLCSALMATEQWGFFSVPNLLWHGTFVYNGHLRGPVTLVPIAKHLQWSCHYLYSWLTIYLH